jgi:hypothetical protein
MVCSYILKSGTRRGYVCGRQDPCPYVTHHSSIQHASQRTIKREVRATATLTHDFPRTLYTIFKTLDLSGIRFLNFTTTRMGPEITFVFTLVDTIPTYACRGSSTCPEWSAITCAEDYPLRHSCTQADGRAFSVSDTHRKLKVFVDGFDNLYDYVVAVQRDAVTLAFNQKLWQYIGDVLDENPQFLVMNHNMDVDTLHFKFVPKPFDTRKLLTPVGGGGITQLIQSFLDPCVELTKAGRFCWPNQTFVHPSTRQVSDCRSYCNRHANYPALAHAYKDKLVRDLNVAPLSTGKLQIYLPSGATVNLTNLVKIQLINVVGYSEIERKTRKAENVDYGNGSEPVPAIWLQLEVHVNHTQSEEMKQVASAVNGKFLHTTACDVYLPTDPDEATGTLLNSVVSAVTENTLVLEKTFYDDTHGPIDWQAMGGLSTLDIRTRK